MDVADRVTVMNDGRVEQSGKPRDLEHPANEFVMGFVGPVNRLGEAWIRPHDLELRLEPVARPARRWSSASSLGWSGSSSCSTTVATSPLR